MLLKTRRLAVAVLCLFALLPLLPQPTHAAPWVQARNWIIVDSADGTILAADDPYQQTAMASLTKVMTALVAVERAEPSLEVTIVRSDLIGEASAGLRSGETLSLHTLLHGLMMPSGNDAAMAIARAVGGSPHADDPSARARFIGWMNERAASLDLTNTHFTNPHGLDQAGHYTSVYDLSVIVREAIKNPRFVEPFSARTFSAQGHNYQHGNKLPDRYPGVLGGKTGWTGNAGLCLIEVAKRDGRELIVVLIGSTFARWYDDAADLLDYGWTIPVPATNTLRATSVFTWWSSRQDQPVAKGMAQRSWVWGSAIGTPDYRSYVDAPNGERIVQYFDKGRMEVNDPEAPLDSGWYVTGGRLAWELISGYQQIGDHVYLFHGSAEVPVAGDPSESSVTYATLAPLLLRSPAKAGSLVTQRLSQAGTVNSDPSTGSHGVTVGEPFPETNHGVASVFETFLNQHGRMYIDGQYVEAPLFSPPFATSGFPITEPYWVRAPVSGVEQDVLIQCFERRCLTYTPSNPDDWKVEMGNIGQHYLGWLESTT